MIKKMRFRNAFVAATILAASCLPVQADTPQHDRRPPLAELWVQTSAEYKALCYQTYTAASHQFDAWAPYLKKRADGKAYLDNSQKPLAIILDLDETVVDNSGFQAFSVKTGAKYNPFLWNAWVEFQGINASAGRMVPGATEFLNKMKDMGVTPIFISNRTVGQEAPTIKVLQRAGLDLTDIENRVLLREIGDGEERQAREVIAEESLDPNSKLAQEVLEGEGKKEARRRRIRRKYDVLAYFGDVHGDFEPFLEMADTTQRVFEQRQNAADKHRANWGNTWFILPNPMYGSWGLGQAIPKGEVKSSLNDFGFSTYVRARRAP